MWIEELMAIKKVNRKYEINEYYKEDNPCTSFNKSNFEDLKDFELETTSIWSFPDRGNWASHKGDYRGNFAPQIPRNVILRYTNEGDVVLDPMVGSGTTLIECKLLGRKGIGIDINLKPLKIAKERIKSTETNIKSQIRLLKGDARDLYKIENESVDLICTHPPYLNIIKYSEDNPGDISRTGSVKCFIEDITKVAKECFRVLKPNRYLAILIGDTRKRRHYVPLSAYVLKTFLDQNFILYEDIIKHQWNCTSTARWKKVSMKMNFHMIMHEHLYIFRKPKNKEILTPFKYSTKNNEVF